MSQLKIIYALLFLFIVNFSFAQGWVQLTSGTNLNLSCMYFTDANTGYIGTESGSVLKTTNGGANWVILNTGTNRRIYSVQFVNQNTGFLGTTLGLSSLSSKVLRTTNAGNAWDTSVTGGGNSISFINSTTGYSLRTPNTLKKTTNSGQQWDSIGIIPTAAGGINKILFVNELTGYSCGNEYIFSFMLYNVIIKKTTNGGLDWNAPGYSGPISFFTSIYDLDIISNTGFAVSYSNGTNYFYKTTNASNWVRTVIPGTSNQIPSIDFIDVNTGWLCGLGGKILYSSNGGANWFEQVSGVGADLNEIFMVNNDIGYICGTNGTILKTTNGGITGFAPVGSNITQSYSLYQNYPNPFNPTTQIKFDIPKASFVSLFVYDALGRESAKLINDELKPGTYSYDWDASNFPSGIYFYKLSAGDFIQTRKMVLIK